MGSILLQSSSISFLFFSFLFFNFLLSTLVTEAIFFPFFLVLKLVHIIIIVLVRFLMVDFITCADPYLNTDAGTMSPFEHGEVFVLDDGGEVSITTTYKCQYNNFMGVPFFL